MRSCAIANEINYCNVKIPFSECIETNVKTYGVFLFSLRCTCSRTIVINLIQWIGQRTGLFDYYFFDSVIGPQNTGWTKQSGCDPIQMKLN